MPPRGSNISPHNIPEHLDSRESAGGQAARPIKTTPATLDEAARYAKAYRALETIAEDSKTGHAIPLLFPSNGRPHTSEFDTRSGIWMRDVRTGITHALKDWPTPEELEKLL